MIGPTGWTCLGTGAEHDADIEEIERTLDTPRTKIAIHRCRTCGQLYRWTRFEVNDWSAGGDYSDETYIWRPLEPDEVEAVRQSANYSPRSDRFHRWDSGWRRDGG